MILLTLGGAYLCISLLVLGVGGESLRLSVTRWQCLMVLVAGLLPFLCSLSRVDGSVKRLHVELVAVRINDRDAPCRRRDEPSPTVDANLMGSVGWDGKFNDKDVRLDGKSSSQREEELPGHHGRPARERPDEGRRVHVW